MFFSWNTTSTYVEMLSKVSRHQNRKIYSNLDLHIHTGWRPWRHADNKIRSRSMHKTTHIECRLNNAAVFRPPSMSTPRSIVKAQTRWYDTKRYDTIRYDTICVRARTIYIYIMTSSYYTLALYWVIYAYDSITLVYTSSILRARSIHNIIYIICMHTMHTTSS